MPRPSSKEQLIHEILKEHAALETFLATLTPEEMVIPAIVGPWSVKDVLTHLTAWEQMCLGWYRAGKRGERPKMPAEGYSWRQIPELNHYLYEAHRDEPLEVVLHQFDASYHEILAAIRSMTDDELFTPQVYAWTGSTTLGSYMTSATCSHYTWARKEIRKGLKAKAPIPM